MTGDQPGCVSGRDQVVRKLAQDALCAALDLGPEARIEERDAQLAQRNTVRCRTLPHASAASSTASTAALPGASVAARATERGLSPRRRSRSTAYGKASAAAGRRRGANGSATAATASHRWPGRQNRPSG